MKQSPFPDLATFLRVLVKALILVVLVNALLLQLQINPVRTLILLNTWDLLGRGRARLTYPSDFQNGQLPLEALLAAHEISVPKLPDEYRVVLLGESGIAGWGVADEDTLSGQLTGRRMVIDGRRLIAYNLAYPQPGAARDLLVLDAALAYDPDVIIWFVTPAALNNDPEITGANRVFYGLNEQRLNHLVARHSVLLEEWYAAHAPGLLEVEPLWQRYVAIDDQELLPIWLNTLFYPFFTPDLAISDRRIGLEPVPEDARYTEETPGFDPMPNEAWNLILAGCLRADAEGSALLVVNEPMLIGYGSHSDENYNSNYQRALYDRYRDTLTGFAEEYHLWYADLWNVVPAERFTDTPLHADAEGYTMLSASLEAILEQGVQRPECE